jgi:tRNA-binding EMAP/Myf-like protein
VEELRAQFGGQASMASEPFPLDLRVATITDVKDHPDATAAQLSIVTVDLGATDLAPPPPAPSPTSAAAATAAAASPAAAAKKGGKGGAAKKEEKKDDKKEEKKEWLPNRQIVTALRGHYTAEQLIGRQVVVAINTKTAQIKKVPSQGIILIGAQVKPDVSGVCSPKTSVPNGTLVRPKGAKIELSKAFDLLKHFQALNLVTRTTNMHPFSLLSLCQHPLHVCDRYCYIYIGDGSAAFYGELPLLTETGVAVVADKVQPGAFLKF